MLSDNNNASSNTPALIATLITAPQGFSQLSDITKRLAHQLGSGNLVWLAEQIACDIYLDETIDRLQAEKRLSESLADLPIDFAITSSLNRKKRVLIADMDSTMIEQECIDELAAEIGIKEAVSAITVKAMNGEIEFVPALRERVALLKGLDETVAETVIKKRITLASGGKTLIATLKANGVYCALVSGGFTSFTRPIAKIFGFDENRANQLLSENGKLTGKVKEPVLGSAEKVIALNEIAAQKHLTADDFIAVGDGANDLGMLKIAGMGVALHAKPSVAAQADIKINHGDLTALLYLQGYKKSEFINV